MAMPRYDRENFYFTTEVDGIVERDFVKNYFELFEIKRQFNYFTLTKDYIQRPDLFSLAVYGAQDFWWIVSRYNGIEDWWNDLEPGDVIKVPAFEDIEDWYVAVRAKKRTEE